MTSFKYTGRDNLDIMSLAENYNSSIYKWLSKNVDSDSAILDYGAGQGEFFYRFKENYANIFAIELDTNMHNYFPDKQVFPIIDKCNNKFNLIYSINVLEHIKDDSLSVKSFKKYLEKESVVKVFVPARQELYSEMDVKVGHYRRYSKKQLKKLFEDNGYNVTLCKYFDFFGYFATAAYKFFGGSGGINPKTLVFYDKYIFPISLIFDKIFSGIIGKNIVLEARLKAK